MDDIRERMEVVGSCGRHVGYVETVDGDVIRLMRDTPDTDAPHHTMPLAWVAHIGQTVVLYRDADAAKRGWGHS